MEHHCDNRLSGTFWALLQRGRKQQGERKKKETRLAENPKASDRRYRTEMKIHTIVTCLLLPE